MFGWSWRDFLNESIEKNTASKWRLDNVFLESLETKLHPSSLNLKVNLLFFRRNGHKKRFKKALIVFYQRKASIKNSFSRKPAE